MCKSHESRVDVPFTKNKVVIGQFGVVVVLLLISILAQ